MELVKQIITDIITTLYQPFWFSVLLTITASFVYLYAYQPVGTGKGIKEASKAWVEVFKSSIYFRKLVFLIFYTVMILFRTLFYRATWLNPLQDVMGGWWIWKTSNSTGEVSLTSECFENVLLMMPFVFLLLLTAKDKILKKVNAGSILWFGVKIGFLFSLGIEISQLFLRLGTFQFADLFYNTIGGFLGAMVYWIGWKIKMVKMRKENDK